MSTLHPERDIPTPLRTICAVLTVLLMAAYLSGMCWVASALWGVRG